MDDKKEAIATRITIVLFVLLLAAAAGVFAYTLKLHGCYKNSIQVTAEIDDIAIDSQSNVQVTYRYTYDGKEYTTQRSSRVEEMKRGDKKEIKISKTDKSEVLPYESEIENILPFAAIDAMLLLLVWVLWLKCVKKKIKKMMPAGKPAGISLHEKFIILYVYTKNTGKSGNTKRKELKKWTKNQARDRRNAKIRFRIWERK